MAITHRKRILPAALALAMQWKIGGAFSAPSQVAGPGGSLPRSPSSPRRARAATFALGATAYTPVFDFTLSDPATKQKSASSFERIDDAIMGGISQSSLRDAPDEPYASWSGVCRTDGGGFCGMRTLPFAAPLNATGADGIYLDCRLASDDEPERRVWKMTVRTDSSRGEMVYQAEYDLRRATDEAKEREGSERGDDWARVEVPFDEFKLVRGPRLMPDGPKLDVTGGIYQIGMTLSKFVMAQSTTELEDFRPGYFDMRIRRIGFYDDKGPSDVAKADASSGNVPDTLSKEEAERKRPLLLRILLPGAKLFFSEKANRRRSAMRILTEERGLGRGKAILFGVRSRKRSMGAFPSVMKTLGILTVDALRAVVFTCVKIVLVYPLRALGAIVRTVKRMLGMKIKPSMRE
mmetsp:Transcript_11941/g.25861  ORF Transcript_11941/g.25861 Transcript_11941/m.25861 type:complete len:407 (-) Transcript_11941:112-1332(-)